jgi:hypothetical protein
LDVQGRLGLGRNVGRSATVMLYMMNGLKRWQITLAMRSRFKNETITVNNYKELVIFSNKYFFFNINTLLGRAHFGRV